MFLQNLLHFPTKKVKYSNSKGVLSRLNLQRVALYFVLTFNHVGRRFFKNLSYTNIIEIKTSITTVINGQTCTGDAGAPHRISRSWMIR